MKSILFIMAKIHLTMFFYLNNTFNHAKSTFKHNLIFLGKKCLTWNRSSPQNQSSYLKCLPIIFLLPIFFYKCRSLSFLTLSFFRFSFYIWKFRNSIWIDIHFSKISHVLNGVIILLMVGFEFLTVKRLNIMISMDFNFLKKENYHFHSNVECKRLKSHLP